MKVILFFVLLIAYSPSNFAAVKKRSPASAAKKVDSPRSLLEKRLRNNKFPPAFIKALLKHYDDSKRDQIIKLNVMGFLLSPDYSGHISDEGLKRCRQFLKAHEKEFLKAEKKFGVKKEVIAALLWVETRLGDNTGAFHVASVYLSLLQGEHLAMVQMLLEDLRKRRPNPHRSLIEKAKTRAQIKGRWAVGELWALYKMNKNRPNTVSDLKGSYSGAFGYSQFLPSSYVQWAKAAEPKQAPDLYRPQDAIMSVANYLHQNGYKKGKPSSYKKALFHYNRSDDYVQIILQLAEQITKKV